MSRPDASGWDQQAQQALKDAASDVGTVRIALRTAARDRAWSSYTIVLVAKAEETTGKTEQDLSSVQVPPARRIAARETLDLLSQAVASVQEARAHAADGRYDDPGLVDELTRLAKALQAEATKREAAAQ
ncbi:hypothetical protein ACFQ3F_13295 [Nocardioides ginsengisoli]|uniref:Uncharacterized protein n=1 Tax=Nocardioides ginsengisoli TaxID=363868 RepID=A0ABW3W0R5_9ACTN